MSSLSLPALHAAVIEVYEAFRGVISTAVPTPTSLFMKSDPDYAHRRLDRLRAALVPFPRRRLTPDPFVRLKPVQLSFQRTIPGGPLPRAVVGTSAHDAVVRLAGRVYDGLGVMRLREATDPATGKTFLAADYPYGVTLDDGTACFGPPAADHYTAVPWSPELWDRLYKAHGLGLHIFYYSDYFAPHPGTLRIDLEHEASLVIAATPPNAATGQKKGSGKKPSGRGNPGLSDQERADRIKIYAHFKAVGGTPAEYIRDVGPFTGMTVEDSIAFLDACRQHWRKANPKEVPGN